MIRKYIRFALLTLIAVLVLWYFGRSLDWDEVIKSLRQADPTLLFISVLIICVGYLLRAMRWKTLLKPLAESRISALFEATTVGYAAVFLIGRAGEVVRPLWLPVRDRRVRPTPAIVTIGVERFCDLVAIVVVFAVNLIWFNVPAGREAEFAIVNRAGMVLLAGTGAGLIGLAVFKRYSDRVIGLVDRILLRRRFFPDRASKQARKLLDQLAGSLSILSDARAFLATVIWTMLLWFAISVPTWLVMLAFQLPFAFSDALFVMGWAVVGSLAPTPGGAAGAFHTATAASLIFLGVDVEKAAATAIIMHFVYFAPALAFGLYYLLRGEVTVRGVRQMIYSNEGQKGNDSVLAYPRIVRR